MLDIFRQGVKPNRELKTGARQLLCVLGAAVLNERA
jgi:hypothetical protein